MGERRGETAGSTSRSHVKVAGNFRDRGGHVIRPRHTRAARGRRIQARDRHPRSRLASIGFTPRSRNVYKYNAIRIRAQDPYEPRSSIRSTTVLEVDGFNWWPLRLNQCREWSPRLRKILVERDTRKEAQTRRWLGEKIGNEFCGERWRGVSKSKFLCLCLSLNLSKISKVITRHVYGIEYD